MVVLARGKEKKLKRLDKRKREEKEELARYICYISGVWVLPTCTPWSLQLNEWAPMALAFYMPLPTFPLYCILISRSPLSVSTLSCFSIFTKSEENKSQGFSNLNIRFHAKTIIKELKKKIPTCESSKFQSLHLPT